MMNRISLNPCGRLNLTTGKNLHFNVLTDWTGDESYALCRFTDWDRADAIILLGSFGGVGDIGDLVDLHHGQTNAFMGTILIEDTFTGGADALDEIRNIVGNSIRFATLD